MPDNIAIARDLTPAEITALFSPSAAREFNYFWGLTCTCCKVTVNACFSTGSLPSAWICKNCNSQNALTNERPRPPVHSEPVFGPSKVLINAVLQKLWMTHLFH